MTTSLSSPGSAVDLRCRLHLPILVVFDVALICEMSFYVFVLDRAVLCSSLFLRRVVLCLGDRCLPEERR